MAEPPIFNGAANAMLAWVSPAVATGLTGAPGTTGLTANERDTCVAARNDELPAWSALTVQVPAVMKVSTPALVMLQTPWVDDVNVTDRPDVDAAPPARIDRSGDVP
ncbi:hypothetical protein D3C81_1283900 [compost metagenome]